VLGPGRYLLGVVEVLLLAGFAGLGGGAVRRWLLPRFEGAPAWLATGVAALALLIWVAEALGSFGALDPLPYLLLVAIVGLVLWRFLPRPPGGGRQHPNQQLRVRATSPRRDERRREVSVATVIAVVVAAATVVHFAAGVRTRLSTGMTGFDSTWYHGPFAAGFFQSGDTWSLHFIAPQFLAWFYPANSEIFHTVGMLAFSRDLLSPLLNLGWFLGCLFACWCIGRPYRVAPWSLALGAIALSVPALADQAGEARNDIVGIFFLLAAVAVAVNARAGERMQPEEGLAGEGGVPGLAPQPIAGGVPALGPYLVVGLAAGLAAGTKLNFLLPASVLVVGVALIAPRGARLRAVGAVVLAALAGGGYWYLRNLAHVGNPLPWIHHLGPIDLPAPEQGLGGREAHSVLSYLTDGGVWSDWFLPGLHHGLWFLWPPLLAAALAGLLFCLFPFLARWAETSKRRGRRADFGPNGTEIGPSAREGALAVAGLVGIAGVFAWLIAPTSASGPDGMPRGFESGLRYLAPALILGLALLPTAPPLRRRLTASVLPSLVSHSDTNEGSTGGRGARQWVVGCLALVLAAAAVGYPVQRHYLADRYKDPTFTAPGLNAAFAWARDISDARIATTSTRQYPLFGTDLSNHVLYLGTKQPHGGFDPPRTCPQYRRLLNAGDYDYVITTRDRLEPAKPPYPRSATWTERAGAQVVLRKPPTIVFKLRGRPSPSAC
jgi:hypothetical protein